MSYCTEHFTPSENVVVFVFSHKGKESCAPDKMDRRLEISIYFRVFEESVEKRTEALLKIEVPYIFCMCIV
jgi:hypothetical protein